MFLDQYSNQSENNQNQDFGVKILNFPIIWILDTKKLRYWDGSGFWHPVFGFPL